MYLMLKRLKFAMLCLCLSGMADAQVATWMVTPEMDNIEFDAANKLFICNKKDSTFIWNTNGRQIVATNKHVTPFMQQLCLLTEEDNGLYGILSVDGRLKKMEKNDGKCRYSIDSQFPYYSLGYLLVLDTQDSLYHYINKNCIISHESYCEAYPFLNRYASVSYYKNPEKRKNKVTALINTKYEEVTMQKNGKAVETGDFEFISSLNKEKKAICISGKQVFVYDYETDNCTRYSDDESNSKESFVQIVDKVLTKENTEDGGFTIATNKGKLIFNHNGEFKGADWFGPITEPASKQQAKVQKNLKAFKDNDMVGLTWFRFEEEKTVMPAQFEDVKEMFNKDNHNDLAVVRKNGKYGIVSVNNKDVITMQVNNNDTLFFTSDTCRSKLTITFPFRIARESIQSIVTSGDNICEVDMASLQENVTGSGSKFTFDCIPHLPNMQADNSAKQKYSFSVEYNDITSMPIECNNSISYKSSWAVSNANASVQSDTVIVEFCIVDENSEQRDVKASINSDTPITNKIETVGKNSFKAMIYGLNPGETQFDIIVKEQKGYTQSFPFKLKYEPAKGKKAGTASLKQAVSTKQEEL